MSGSVSISTYKVDYFRKNALLYKSPKFICFTLPLLVLGTRTGNFWTRFGAGSKRTRLCSPEIEALVLVESKWCPQHSTLFLFKIRNEWYWLETSHYQLTKYNRDTHTYIHWLKINLNYRYIVMKFRSKERCCSYYFLYLLFILY